MDFLSDKDLSFLQTTTNQYWQMCRKALERENLGIIERRQYQEGEEKAKELLMKFEKNHIV